MKPIVAAVFLLLALAGCSASPYDNPPGTVYEGSSCGAAPGVIGGLLGAGGGALLGNQFGHGTGKSVATGLGALAGAGGGYEAGNAVAGC